MVEVQVARCRDADIDIAVHRNPVECAVESDQLRAARGVDRPAGDKSALKHPRPARRVQVDRGRGVVQHHDDVDRFSRAIDRTDAGRGKRSAKVQRAVVDRGGLHAAPVPDRLSVPPDLASSRPALVNEPALSSH